LEYNISEAAVKMAAVSESSNHGTVPLLDPATGRPWQHESAQHESVMETVKRLAGSALPLFDEHPEYRQAAGLECEVGAGDAVFIPRGWHHALLSEDDPAFCAHAAINYWFEE
jgi:hypothetical protein